MERKVSCLWKEPGAPNGFRCGVSLHSHTNHSQESLGFIGDYLRSQPLLHRWLQGQERTAIRRSANPVNFDKSYWTPPLTPVAAFQLETRQIERTLGLERSMVSLSDHDTIGAPMALRVLPEFRHVPISVEWTVPFGKAEFHVGVHNLPGVSAESLMAELRAYTLRPERRQLTALLKELHAQREVLVVLNHPYWDLARLGPEQHEMALTALLAEEGERIHALELSGIRSWEENGRTRRLAESFNQMLVSGGDRHGTEPNATVNLTDAVSFAAFVDEIRRERRGHVLFLPQYQQSNLLRILETLQAVVREYPEFPNGSRRWDERVFHPDLAGAPQPLAALWARPPAYLKLFFAVLSLLECRPVQQALRATLRHPGEGKSHTASGLGEVSPL